MSEDMVLIRSMTPADLEAAGRITHAADPFGWTLRNWQDALASGYELSVIEEQSEIAGFCAVMHVLDECELLEIVIDPEKQARGLGKKLLREAIALAKRNGAQRMHLEVRVGNAVARKMYISAGFAEVGVRKNYYRTQEGREDAVLMTLEMRDI